MIAAVICMAPAFAARAQQWKKQDFKALAAVKGMWLTETPGEKSYLETWTVKNDTLMEGRAFYVDKDKKQEPAETAQLVYSAGKIRYIVTVIGQNEDKPVVFDLVTKKGKVFTFENKEHDFPKQIIYRFPKNNALQVTINGTTPQGDRTVDFKFKKVGGRKFE